MPLKKTTSSNKKVQQKAVSANIKELVKDNQKSGKSKGDNGKPRSMKQIVAIALSQAKYSKKSK